MNPTRQPNQPRAPLQNPLPLQADFSPCRPAKRIPAISTRSDFRDSLCLPVHNPIEPPWYVTRMPGGVTGKAREGLPMSIKPRYRTHGPSPGTPPRRFPNTVAAPSRRRARQAPPPPCPPTLHGRGHGAFPGSAPAPNSASAAKMPNTRRPAALVASICSPGRRAPADPRLGPTGSCMVLTRWARFRPRWSSFQTTRPSPFHRACRQMSRPGRSSERPEANSWTRGRKLTASTPAAEPHVTLLRSGQAEGLEEGRENGPENLDHDRLGNGHVGDRATVPVWRVGRPLDRQTDADRYRSPGAPQSRRDACFRPGP